MTTMTWKRVILLGGAALILAACEQSAPTGPIVQTTTLQPRAPKPSVRGDQKSSPTPQTTAGECRTGYSVQVGFADSTTSVGLCLR